MTVYIRFIVKETENQRNLLTGPKGHREQMKWQLQDFNSSLCSYELLWTRLSLKYPRASREELSRKYLDKLVQQLACNIFGNI